MENLIMVTGGAKSGKSEFAENLFSEGDSVCYIATGQNSTDSEMQAKIKQHQSRRPKSWKTEERYQHLARFIDQDKGKYFLLDDITGMITNLFFDWVNTQSKNLAIDFDQFVEQMDADSIDVFTSDVIQEWNNILAVVSRRQKTLVMVTNEVGLGIVPATKLTRILRDIYGKVNQLVARRSDEVWFVISGLPQKIK